MGCKVRNYDIYEIISRNIKKYRILANITQEELAEKANYSYQFIRRIEASKTKKTFSLDTLITLTNALNINIVDLFKEVSEEEYNLIKNYKIKKNK